LVPGKGRVRIRGVVGRQGGEREKRKEMRKEKGGREQSSVLASAMTQA
jgi:hypothetical protein